MIFKVDFLQPISPPRIPRAHPFWDLGGLGARTRVPAPVLLKAGLVALGGFRGGSACPARATYLGPGTCAARALAQIHLHVHRSFGSSALTQQSDSCLGPRVRGPLQPVDRFSGGAPPTGKQGLAHPGVNLCMAPPSDAQNIRI